MLAALVVLLGPAPPPAQARLSAHDLFRPPEVTQVVLSPSGTMLAIVEQRYHVDHLFVQRISDGQRVEVSALPSPAPPVVWADDRHLLFAGRSGVTIRNSRYHWVKTVVRYADVAVVAEEEGRLGVRRQRIRARGRLVRVLPGIDGELLWSHSLSGESAVFRIRITDLLMESGHGVRESGRHPKVAGFRGPGIDLWVADREGVPRAAFSHHPPNDFELWIHEPGNARWRLVVESQDAESFPFPRGVTEQGRLLVLNRGEGDTVALHEFDPISAKVGKEVFRDPALDVIDVAYDHRGTVNGVVVERGGLQERRHFDEFYARYQRSLERVFPERSVSLDGASHDERIFVVKTEGPRDPGTFYVLDTGTNEAREVGRAMPWLDPEALHPVEAMLVSSNGVGIEAFLSRPRAASAANPAPLVVLPHGGPRGIRDTRLFDPLVQYVTDTGISVLQVNYRGSAGRGLAFLESGSREWGKGIEDDIEAALARAVALEWVDGSRVCIAGGSYGGYSALISVVRNPNRYRCAASFNGPTDLAFDYYSHFSYWEEGQEYFAKHIGDVEDYDALIELSPAYRVDEITAPILLVHGTEDERVRIDHFHRMRNMLLAANKPHETHLIVGGGHSPTQAQWIDFASRLRTFLRKNLARDAR